MSNKKVVKYYPSAWFKVEFENDGEGRIEFKAFKITSLNEDSPSDSKINNIPSIEGVIKFDDCIDFKQDDHYCGLHHAEQVYELMRELYKYNQQM